MMVAVAVGVDGKRKGVASGAFAKNVVSVINKEAAAAPALYIKIKQDILLLIRLLNPQSLPTALNLLTRLEPVVFDLRLIKISLIMKPPPVLTVCHFADAALHMSDEILSAPFVEYHSRCKALLIGIGADEQASLVVRFESIFLIGRLFSKTFFVCHSSVGGIRPP